MEPEDLDRLADYSAGLLDPDAAARVRHRIEQDADWARAHAALTAAAPTLRAALAELADQPMPADVSARIGRALADERGAAPANVISLDRRRRLRRFSLGAAAAAAAIAVCLGGVTVLRNAGVQNGAKTSGGAGPAFAQRTGAADAQGAGTAGGPTVLTTGTDYTAATLPTIARQSGRPDAARPNAAAAGSGVPEELARLHGDAARSTCLSAIVATGGTPMVVDYGRYQGRPAMVVLVRTGTGQRVVVVGPDCGLAGSGTDQIYAANLP